MDEKLSPGYKGAVTLAPRTATLGDLVPILTDELPAVIDEVVEELGAEWPDYAELLREDSDVVRETAQTALRRLVALAEQGPATSAGKAPETAALFEEVGRIEWREGRSLATLLSAYRAGARVAWGRISRAALRRGVAPEALVLLAEAVFVFVEDLSNASARGYVDEQHATAVERERLRAELAELLMAERADLAVVRAASAHAGWPLPHSVSLVIADPATTTSHELLARLDTRCLPLRRPELVGAIVPDLHGPARRSRLTKALAGMPVVVSSAVLPDQLPLTLPPAMVALRLLGEGVIDDNPLFVADHYDALLVHRDDRLLAALRDQVLAPLAEQPAGARQRLEETLAAWLTHMGDHRAIAATLHVHPQTVRYRLGRLRQLFGASLDDPRTRLRLTLALCWRDGSPGTPRFDDAS